MKRSLLILLSCLLFCPPARAGDPSPHVPLSHGVYRTLDRFDARGWIRIPAAGIRPYTRGKIASLLGQILAHVDSSGTLSRSDVGRLRRLRAEFGLELARLGRLSRTDTGCAPAMRDPVGRSDLLSWQDSVSHAAGNPVFLQRIVGIRGNGAPSEALSQTYLGASIRGVLRDRLGFRVRHYEAREWGSRLRQSRDDVVARPIEDVQLKGKKVDFRQASFEIVWPTQWLDVDLGKDAADWGPSPGANLLLSGYASSFGMIRLRAVYKRLSFIHVIGFLRVRPGLVDSSSTRMDNGYSRTLLKSKHLVAHRVEVDLPRNVTLGVHECVIYAGRGIDARYAVTPAFLSIIQGGRDRPDNALFGVDLAVRPVSNLKLYVAALLDDVGGANGSGRAAYALQGGLFWVDAFGAGDTDLRLDYVRLQPNVYTRAAGETSHEHFDALLGHPIGPNSDRLSLRLSRAFTGVLSADIGASRTRRGQATSMAEPPAGRVAFLAGPMLTGTRISAGVDYEPVRHLVFRIDYEAAYHRSTGTGEAGGVSENRSSWSIGAQYGFF